MTRRALVLALAASLAATHGAVARAQDRPAGTESPANYVIGPDDVLSVVFWRDKELTSDVVVRPDGKISLPLLNDIQAGGLTPAQLRDVVSAQARRFVEEPTVTVIVKQIKSRKLFITGQVDKPGLYALGGPTTVLQLIAMAGGLKEFADGRRILIMRSDAAARRQIGFLFNYEQVRTGKNLEQNIELKPGDTVIVP
jgi:polysaccharide export outer membrane protein